MMNTTEKIIGSATGRRKLPAEALLGVSSDSLPGACAGELPSVMTSSYFKPNFFLFDFLLKLEVINCDCNPVCFLHH